MMRITKVWNFIYSVYAYSGGTVKDIAYFDEPPIVDGSGADISRK